MPLRGTTTGRVSLLAVTAVTALFGAGACGSSNSSSSEGKPSGKPLDLTRVEKSIEQSVFEQRHMHATISCPSYVEQRRGNNFTCYATGTVGTGAHKQAFRTPFEVVQQNDKGYVYYHS